MNKRLHELIRSITIFALLFGGYINVQASADTFHKLLSPSDSAGWSFETSGTVEKITSATDGWILQAGGNVASSHYARIKYKIPENAGSISAVFYMKALIVLPIDFYTQQKAGFRIINTDNYSATLNGAHVGATNADEFRTAVYINSDHSLRVNTGHQNGLQKEFFRSAAPLPVGEHLIELFGNVGIAAPWYLKVDGQVWASGLDRLSTDDVPVSERVVTRLIAGIDGAANQSDNSMSVFIKSFEIANYDLAGASSIPASPTATLQSPTLTAIIPATATLPPPTATNIPVSATFTPPIVENSLTPNTEISSSTSEVATQTPASVIPSPTLVSPGITPNPATAQPATEQVYDDTDGRFVYSSGWTDVSKKQAYKHSYKRTTQNGSYLTFDFTGQSFSVLYTGGTSFRKMDVYIDGVLVGTINQKSKSSSFQRRWDFKGTLALGSHTLKLVFVTSNTSNNTNGSIDAVIVR